MMNAGTRCGCKSKGQDKDPPLAPSMAEAPMDAPASSQINPISWTPSHSAIVGPSWKDFSEIRYLFILYVSFPYVIRVPSPHEKVLRIRSSSILINYLAETRTARRPVNYRGLFCARERVPQTRVTLKVVETPLFI